MKKRYWIILAVIVGAIGFQLLTDFILNKNRPNELQEIIEKAKANREIIERIGGYDSYKIKYDYVLRDAKKDYTFDVTLFGKDAYIDFNGVAHYAKADSSWLIIKNDTILKKY